ncbi:hypothetical protein ABVT39_005554 [Epinephelus coioides]
MDVIEMENKARHRVHRFPDRKRSGVSFRAWVRFVRVKRHDFTASSATKNAAVYSTHFGQEDYVPGGADPSKAAKTRASGQQLNIKSDDRPTTKLELQTERKKATRTFNEENYVRQEWLADVNRSDANLTSEVVLTFSLQSPLQPGTDIVFVSVKDVICIGVTDTLSSSRRALHKRINANRIIVQNCQQSKTCQRLEE